MDIGTEIEQGEEPITSHPHKARPLCSWLTIKKNTLLVSPTNPMGSSYSSPRSSVSSDPKEERQREREWRSRHADGLQHGNPIASLLHPCSDY